jgi:hypothetical protein
MKTLGVLGATVLVGVLALTGCSSSKKTSASSSAPPPASSSSAAPASTSASPSASAAAPTAAALLAITLQQTDVPAGFTATPYQADPTDAADQAALVQCVGGRNTAADQTGEQHSPDYGSQDASISSQAASFKTKDDIDADIAIINSPKINDCYTSLAKSQILPSLPAGSTVNSVSIKITPGSNGGPSNVVGLGVGTVNVTVSGQTATVYLNVAFITGPLIEAEVDFENVGAPVPAATQSALIAAVANRAAAA